MKLTSILLLSSLLLVIPSSLNAGDFSGLREEIAIARKASVALVIYRDRRGPEHQRLVKHTADAVSAHLARLQAPTGKTAEFRELNETWGAYKATREKELVPAILAGEREKAEKIGAGIQKARIDRMYSILDDLEK